MSEYQHPCNVPSCTDHHHVEMDGKRLPCAVCDGESKHVERRHGLSFCDERHLGLEGRHFLYECCEDCNYARHRCHFCGGDTSHDDGGVHPACIPDDADIGREPQPGDEVTPEWDDEFIRREEAAERADVGSREADRG